MIKSTYKKIFSERFRINVINNVSKIISIFYRGNKFYCNCCNKSFKKFLPKGNIRRENAKCPYCGSLERTRLLLLYLQNETDLFKKNNLKLLHVAPENALFDIITKLNIKYIDGDINAAYARNVIDITDIRYPDNYFDLIVCSHVLGHVQDEGKAIRELRRVLNDEGTALIMTLLDLNREKTYESPDIVTSEERLLNYGEPDLCRLHGADFASRLQQQGFKTETIDYGGNFSTDINRRYSLGDGQREMIFKCTR